MKIPDKYLVYDKEEIGILGSLLQSKKLSGTSDIISIYEKELSSYFCSKHALAVSSGTAAILTALSCLGVKCTDEIIISSVCPLMSVLPILHLKAKPVFCDTVELGFGLNPKDLEALITPKTKAVIEVPMWGYPISMDNTSEIARRNNIPIIIDMAQAHGTKLKNVHLSSLADIACFSTHDRKLLSTGEGGFILTNNDEYINKMRAYINFDWMKGERLGLNFKLSALQAAIGLNRLPQITKQIQIRTCIANDIVNNLTNTKIKELPICDEGVANYYALVLHFSVKNTAKVIKELEHKGLPNDILRYGCKNLYKYPMLTKYKRKCPNSELLFSSITTVPVHPGIKNKEKLYIIDSLNQAR